MNAFFTSIFLLVTCLVYSQHAHHTFQTEEGRRSDTLDVLHYEIALDLTDNDEDDADLYALIGMEYLFLDQFENARNYFIKCLELDNDDYSALYNIIYCFFN